MSAYEKPETKLRRGRIWQRAWRSEAQTGGKRAAKKRMRQGVFARWPR